MSTPPLSEDARATALPPLMETGWQPVPGRDAIRKIWRFKGFSEAWGFMSRAALAAERLNHHPEWLNAFNIVDVTLTTHDCGGLSDLDVKLASRMDKLAGAAAVEHGHTSRTACLCETRPGQG
ncbi:hypothetical protein GCM10007291_27010 [Gemmobacter nanjingensis]|uniref:Putative pterin-4-alpha-carbinolamine dehydratase n=1 Tax=Gemmobacter nanjingensis TaxID=488454 RepID=A0ABQ3FIL8_9RHOB|nr:4a-hydroxytetrahydrobiopterin dehydratase [Gemmobacter nanjingensis]GHC25860.1 hypothetical protein GCM10007291_27010 [Gemmobacter nanjingensis]